LQSNIRYEIFKEPRGIPGHFKEIERMIYRVICFDSNADIRSSVCDVIETTSLFSAIARLLKYNFYKEDNYGEPIIKAGLSIYKSLGKHQPWSHSGEPIYSSQYVRKFYAS